MARVFILTYDHHVDRRPVQDGLPEVRFEPTKVTLENGGRVLLGTADVPTDVAERYYATHPSFRVQWTPEENAVRERAQKDAERKQAAAAAAAAKAAKDSEASTAKQARADAEKVLRAMTKEDLLGHAATRNVPVPDGAKKDEVLALLLDDLDRVDSAPPKEG